MARFIDLPRLSRPTIAVIVVVLLVIIQDWLQAGMHFYFWLGVIFLAWAISLLVRAGATGRKSWVIEKATPLGLDLINPRDDAWVMGRIECETPLTVPHFGRACVAFKYREQILSRGARGVRFTTIADYGNQVEFDIVDRVGRRITVAAHQAEFDGLQDCGDIEGFNHRYTASFLPYPFAVEAVGSVSEDCKRLERYANIPLIVTTRGRLAYIAGCGEQEQTGHAAGGVLLWLGVFGTWLGILSRLSGPGPAIQGGTPGGLIGYLLVYVSLGLLSLRGPEMLNAAGVASSITGVWLLAFLYNRLVVLRERVKTAWRHIDVDLKNRHDLLPELIRAVQAYAAHERSIADILTRLRYDTETGVGLDRREAALVPLEAFWLLAERYPELKANQNFQQLREELTALEDKIAFARSFYNQSLLRYDNARKTFPSSVIAQVAKDFPIFEPFGEVDETEEAQGRWRDSTA
ncbi:MAG: LemA family protein [candidate division WOR-3 bacterium]